LLIRDSVAKRRVEIDQEKRERRKRIKAYRASIRKG
jgi:hypothetical protein